jgi:hypothetical protein
MIVRLALCHVALALGAALLSAAVRTRSFRPSAGALDALIGLLLPVVGPATVLAGLLLELAFRRRGTAPRFDDDGPLEDVPLRGREADPVEELRIGTSVSPVAEVFAHGDLEEVDRALRRLILSERPGTLVLLRDALHSARLDVRVRARGLIVRVEDRLLALARGSADPLERARALRKLACLSADPVSLQQHLRGAIASYEQALARDPGSPAGGELGRLLLQSGDHARARQVLTRHLQRHPGDSEARLARAQAALRAADLPAARRDCATLRLPALE